MSQIDNLLKEIGPVREEGQQQSGDREMAVEAAKNPRQSKRRRKSPAKSHSEPGAIAGPGGLTVVLTSDGWRNFYSEDILNFPEKEKRPSERQLFVLRIVDDFNHDTKPHQVERSHWRAGKGLMKRLKAGDRVAVLKKGEQKVYAIGTVIGIFRANRANPSTAGGDDNEVAIKYDLINPVGIAVYSNNGKSLLYNVSESYRLLSRQEFDDLLVRLVRAF